MNDDNRRKSDRDFMILTGLVLILIVVLIIIGAAIIVPVITGVPAPLPPGVH